MNASREEPQEDDHVPVFNSWRAWYVMVIAFLALLVLAFYYFTQYFA